jgi:hypothetical protein
MTWMFLCGHQADTYVGTGPSVIYHALVSCSRLLLLPSTYLAAGTSPALPAPILQGLKLLAAALLGLVLVAGALRFSRLWAGATAWLPLALALAVPYGLFFTFWDPGGYFFWLPQAIPFWLLAGAAALNLPRRLPPRTGTVLVGAAVTALFLLNLAGGILPESRLDRVADHRLSRTLSGEVEAGDLVLLNSSRMEILSNFGGPLFYGYARAFAPYEVHCLLPGLDDPGFAADTQAMVDGLLGEGYAVYYLDETLHGRPTHGGRGGRIREAFRRWGLRPVLVKTHPGGDAYGGTLVYRLERDALPAGIPDGPEML